MKTEREILLMKGCRNIVVAVVVLGSLGLNSARAQTPVKITLDQAIDLALKHNHTLQAARTVIQQNQAAEITANLRPNPTVFTDWEYLPISKLPGESLAAYLQGSTEGDIGMSYLIERGKKRERRLQAARDATAVTRSQVFDNERTLGFQVAQLFYNVLLAESVLDLANTDLKSFQTTVDISERPIQDRRHQSERLPARSSSNWCSFNRVRTGDARAGSGALGPAATIRLRIRACRLRCRRHFRIPAAGG